MDMELGVALPKEAALIRSDVAALQVIEVVDDRTNIAASENLKLVKQRVKAFEDACEPVRVQLRTPLDLFLALKKEAKDQIDGWIAQQTKSIGTYAQELMRQENARKLAEQQKRDEEEKARIEKLNAENEAKAALDGTEAKTEEFIPSQETVQIEKTVTKSEFATASVKEKPSATVTDMVLFIQTLIENGKDDWAKLIFDKVNQSQLNKFCAAQGINGRDKRFPGIAVEMVAEVRTR